MVYASNGVLITTDIPTKELLIHENSKAAPNNKFLISVLDDTHLFVKPDKVEFVQEKVREFNDRNVYQPPTENKDEAAARGRFGRKE
ncbi:MAG: TFIIH subunit TTDA/Tfb5 [Monoraphidium minutum]|nr:MAG: TFIIH subunit TTDA/Tfb5 [Monoraphidium minutum]